MNWERLITPPALRPRQIDVWRIIFARFESRVGEFEGDLSAAEVARANRFVFAEDREKFIIGRSILRRLLAEYVGVSRRELKIEAGQFGKPLLSNPSNGGGIRFNLSHSAGLCLIAFRPDGEIGIDIERVRPEIGVVDLAQRYFAAEEVAALEELSQANQVLGFFRCWTRKEAYVKARGEGLQIPLDRFAVSLNPGNPVKLKSPDADLWQVQSIDPAEGYEGAIATESGPIGVTYWDYEGS
jgi:4'-phosphopantetheinyl transferase